MAQSSLCSAECWYAVNKLFTRVTASNFQRLLAPLILAAHRRNECYMTGADMKGRVYPYWVSVNNFVSYGPEVTFKQQPACSTSCSLILVETGTGNQWPVPGDLVTHVGIRGGGEIISVPAHDHQVRLQQRWPSRWSQDSWGSAQSTRPFHTAIPVIETSCEDRSAVSLTLRYHCNIDTDSVVFTI